MMVFLVPILVIIFDRVTKIFVSRACALHESLTVIPNIFHISLVHNRGAAFGVLTNQVPLFIAVSVVAVIMIMTQLRKRGQNALFVFSLCLILGGALGNLIDRIFLGYVIDFIDLRIWPVFNVADSAITIGAVIAGWKLLREK